MLSFKIGKFTICFLVLILNSIVGFSQSYQMDDIDGTIVTTCSGFFYDSRVGTSDYYNNENYTATFCSATAGDVLRFIVNPNENASGYAIADAGDILTVYDGTGTTGTILGTYSSGDDPGSNSFIIQATSECITFDWVSNGAGDSDGWMMTIECVPPGCGSNPDPADDFADAPYICNLDGFCASTKGYTDDEPFNFIGGGSCPVIFGGTIENNSWIVFEATGTNISFDIDVIGCYGAFGYDEDPSSSVYGIQAAILSYDGVSTLTRMSDCNLSDGSQLSFTLTNTTPLTVGDTYYLVVDGSAGSQCDYSINVSGDVATVDAGADQEICPGDDLDLTATGPSGATYVWNALDASVINDIGQSQTYNPNIETIYVVEVTSGLCLSSTDTVVATICSLLPIELKDFTVSCEFDYNQLYWETYSELNNDYFILERASSDFVFERIGIFQGQLNSSSITEYSYNDHSMNTGAVYYRLSQVDLDGNQQEIKTIRIHQTCIDGFVNRPPYYSNESSSIHLDLNNSDDLKTNYYLVDLSGRIVSQNEETLQNGGNEIKIEGLAEAVYFLIIDSPLGHHKYKLIISH